MIPSDHTGKFCRLGCTLLTAGGEEEKCNCLSCYLLFVNQIC